MTKHAKVLNKAEWRFSLLFILIAVFSATQLAHEALSRLGFLPPRLDALASDVEMVMQVILLALVCAAAPLLIGELSQRRLGAKRAHDSRENINLLFQMTEMLQSALGHADANTVLRSTATDLLPGRGGALYIFNNSGDRLELSTSWSWPDRSQLAETISPSSCWALKRGKFHVNAPGQHGVCCDHHGPDGPATIEIPMMARGEVYGLLVVEEDAASSAEEQVRIRDLAGALAEAMSLSLANLALRDRLRAQALRDPLTGLYNRRHLEEAFERHLAQAERDGSALSLIMIDLDHFKAINDNHGHAMGDAVLASVGTAIAQGLRPCDIACRYGGEEFAILLPDCSPTSARSRAEELRERIERLSSTHRIPVSASLGVGTSPDTSSGASLFADADRALYRAKKEGRNKVVDCSPLTGKTPNPVTVRAA